MRVDFVPVLDGLYRRSAPQGGLRQLRVVTMNITYQCLFEVKGAVEIVGFNQVTDAALEAFRGRAMVFVHAKIFFLHTTRRGMPSVWSDFSEVRHCSMPNAA